MRFRAPASFAVAAAALAVVILAILWPAPFARGWLCAFVLATMIPIGSLSMLLTHRLTGGQWGEDLAPVFVPAARAMPLLLLASLPILILRPLIYAWPQQGVAPDVVRLYMNPTFFDIRTLVGLAALCVLAYRPAWRTRVSAAIGLVVLGIVATFLPADWILSTQSGTESAAFGFAFWIEQMFAALAFAAVQSHRGIDARANKDLSGLLVSTLLGTMYFVYMQFIIIWYGNIPEKVAWYATRAVGVWPLIGFAAFMLGAVIPFVMSLFPVVRESARWLRIVGAAVLLGIALHVVWFLVPSLGESMLLFAVLDAFILCAVFAVLFRDLVRHVRLDHARA
jgi:hypothetical protein